MKTIKVRMTFLPNVRSYIPSDEDDIIVSYPLGALPNKGDIIQIENIGVFSVYDRFFEVRQDSLYGLTLSLGDDSAYK